MTEYDFSPEAFDRYTRTQQRIVKWVDNTESHRGEFKLDAHHLYDPSLLVSSQTNGPGYVGATATRLSHRPSLSVQDVSVTRQHRDRYRRRRSSSRTSTSSSSAEQHLRPVPLQTRLSMKRRPSQSHGHSIQLQQPRPVQVAMPATYLLTTSPPISSPTYPYTASSVNATLVSSGPYGAGGTGGYVKAPKTLPARSPPPPYYTPNQASCVFPQPSVQQQPQPHHQVSIPIQVHPGSYAIYAPQPQPQQPVTQAGVAPAAYVLAYPQPSPAPVGSTFSPVYPVIAGSSPIFPNLQQPAPTPGQKPLFYQRIFRPGGGEKSKSKGSSSRKGH